MRRQLCDDGFAVVNVEIVGVGAIDHLSWDCKDADFMQVIYAGNGVGKTTLLECLSLVGHLPCLPVLTTGGGGRVASVTPSILRQRIGGQVAANVTLQEVARAITNSGQPTSLDAMVAAFVKRGYETIGMIRFRVRNASDQVDFAVLVQSDDDNRPSLTALLSRYPQRDYSPDTDLETNFLVISAETLSPGSELWALCGALARGRTFSLAEGEHLRLHELPGLPEQGGADTGIADHGPVLRVTYINTDLNDFGRGNDLRESPKNLRETMEEQLLVRLRLTFDDDGEYVAKKRLNTALTEILPTSQSNYADVHAIGEGLQIVKLHKSPDNHLTVDIERGDVRIKRAAFLSAGENEVFFILLICLLLQASEVPHRERGIVLLDEPDLHLANAAKAAFYGEIIALCKGSQVVIASHSYSAVAALRAAKLKVETHTRVLYRARVKGQAGLAGTDKKEGPATKLKFSYDPRYVAAVRRSETRAGARVPGAVLFRDMQALLAGKLAPHYGGPGTRWAAKVTSQIGATVLVLLLPLVAFAAIVNDIVDVVEHQRGKATGESAQVSDVHYLVSLTSVVITAALVYLAIYWAVTRLLARSAAAHPGEPEFEYGVAKRIYPVITVLLSVAGSIAFAVMTIAVLRKL